LRLLKVIVPFAVFESLLSRGRNDGIHPFSESFLKEDSSLIKGDCIWLSYDLRTLRFGEDYNATLNVQSVNMYIIYIHGNHVFNFEQFMFLRVPLAHMYHS